MNQATAKLILLIDDDPPVRDIIKRMLQPLAVTIVEAGDGVSGMAHFMARRPWLVITDISMPAKDGIEVISEIRATDPNVPIIAMSGGYHPLHGDPLGVARQAGATDAISKPILRAAFVTMVERALANASPTVVPLQDAKC